jgi:hypothetical protein
MVNRKLIVVPSHKNAPLFDFRGLILASANPRGSGLVAKQARIGCFAADHAAERNSPSVRDSQSQIWNKMAGRAGIPAGMRAFWGIVNRRCRSRLAQPPATGFDASGVGKGAMGHSRSARANCIPPRHRRNDAPSPMHVPRGRERGKIADQLRLRLGEREARGLGPAPRMEDGRMALPGQEATGHQAEPIRRSGDEDFCRWFRSRNSAFDRDPR